VYNIVIASLLKSFLAYITMFYIFTRRGQGILFALCFLLSLFVFGIALADTSGPNNPSTGADDSSIGTITWTNPTRVTASDNSYATASLNDNQISHYLKATGFGFAIPAGSTINGITASIEKKASTGKRIQDYRVRIIKGGVIGSTDKADTTQWGTSDTSTIYGGVADLWGETWTVSDINNSNFGLAISAYKNATQGNAVTASVDNVRITITYTVNNPVPTTTSISPTSKAYGEAQFTMTVNGTNFISTSIVNFNGSARTTTYVSPSQLTAIIPASDLLSVGTANITVFNPAPGGGASNSQTFTITKADQAALTAVATPSTVQYGTTATLSTTGGSGTGAVTFDVGASTGCSVTDTTLSVINASGSCSVTATKAADATYNATTSPAIIVTLTKADQTITFGPLADKALNSGDFAVSASASSGLTVTFTSQTPSVCTVSTDTVSLVSTGTCTIRAAQGGDDYYNSAPTVDQSFLVVQSAVKFVITEATDGTIDLASLVVIQAQDGAGNVVDTYQQDVTLVASGSATGGGLVNIVNGVGTTTISNNVVETVNLSL
jgi:hypothetical protein